LALALALPAQAQTPAAASRFANPYPAAVPWQGSAAATLAYALSQYDAEGKPLVVDLQGGDWHEEVYAAGAMVGAASGGAFCGSACPSLPPMASPDGAELVIRHGGIDSTGVCNNDGSPLTVSSGLSVLLQDLILNSGCPGGSALFVQNGAYVTFGAGVSLTSTAPAGWNASADFIHTEAGGYVEVPASTTIALAGNVVDLAAVGPWGGLTYDGGDDFICTGVAITSVYYYVQDASFFSDKLGGASAAYEGCPAASAAGGGNFWWYALGTSVVDLAASASRPVQIPGTGPYSPAGGTQLGGSAY
jgi:hypothetical protein